ncbi:MAG: cupin domain-containing protein [Armatimonadetes bacterium]|nr:cupin domain-containing protein [Armatimonadota bacterium]
MTSDADASTGGLRGATTGTDERPAQQLAEPVMHFDLSHESQSLQAEPPMERSGHNANTLVHFPDLRVVLVSVRKGQALRDHRAPGRISIQPLQGQIRVHTQERTVEMKSGELLVLDKAVRHEVEAVEDAVFLLTLGAPTAD